MPIVRIRSCHPFAGWDLFFIFELAPRGPRLSFKLQVVWKYCFGDIAVAFWLEMPIFSGFGGF